MIAGEQPSRILHLFEALEPFQARPLYDALTGGRMGLAAWGLQVSPKEIRDLCRLPQIRRALRDATIVQCWDTPSLVLAGLIGAKRIIFSPQTSPDSATIRWLKAVSGYRDVHVVCPTMAMRHRVLSGGFPVDHCHLVRPGVDFGRIHRRRDADLRRRLDIAGSDFIVLAPGASTDASNHSLAVWAASIAGIIDPTVRLLIEGFGPRALAAKRLGAKLGQPRLVVTASRLDGEPTPERLLPAADAVLVTATGAAEILPIAVCMAAAMPIVSVVTPTLAELLEDRHTALMASEPKARLLAQKLLAVKEDAQLQWQISDRARAEAYELWPLSKSLAAWRELYEKLKSE